MKVIKFKTAKQVKEFLKSNDLGFNKNNVIINGIKPLLGFNVSNKHISYYSSEKQATNVLTSSNGYFILERLQ